MPSGKNQLSHKLSSACSGIRLSIHERAALWIKSDGKPVKRHLPYRLSHPRHVVSVVGHLIVGDQEVAIIAALQAHQFSSAPA